MRDGNGSSHTNCHPVSGFSLPMRDGNEMKADYPRIDEGFSLPMRDGNKAPPAQYDTIPKF